MAVDVLHIICHSSGLPEKTVSFMTSLLSKSIMSCIENAHSQLHHLTLIIFDYYIDMLYILIVSYHFSNRTCFNSSSIQGVTSNVTELMSFEEVETIHVIENDQSFMKVQHGFLHVFTWMHDDTCWVLLLDVLVRVFGKLYTADSI